MIKKIKNAIRYELINKGKTIEEFADMLDMPASTLKHILYSNSKRLNNKTHNKLIKYFGKQYYDIIT